MRPRLLDLFCGAGGAAMGYHRAGFDVVGVDIKPQPNYPFEFHQADALEYLAAHGHEFDAVHASPPCQSYSRTGHLADAQGGRRSQVRLIEPTRNLLRALGRPYVIENVEGAPLESALMLCGSMFGLRVRRHRLFETSVMVFGQGCNHDAQGRPVGVLNWGKWGHEIPSGGRMAESLADAQDAMGIDWMKRPELAEAIPPHYTEFIGRQLLDALAGEVSQDAAGAVSAMHPSVSGANVASLAEVGGLAERVTVRRQQLRSLGHGSTVRRETKSCG